MSNKAYETLRFIAEILLPAIGTLYVALAGIWGFPYAEPIVSTVTAIDVFLGVFVAYMRKKYNEGSDNTNG